MNSLSWLLYLSEAIPGIAPFFVTSGLLTIGLATGLFMYGCFEREGAYQDAPGYGAEGRKQAREMPRWQSGVSAQRRAMKILPLCLVFFFLAGAVPSKQTILMIAASEMGEAVVKTPEAQEVFTDLKVILKQQLEALKK